MLDEYLGSDQSVDLRVAEANMKKRDDALKGSKAVTGSVEDFDMFMKRETDMHILVRGRRDAVAMRGSTLKPSQGREITKAQR